MRKRKILEIGPYPPPSSGWSVRIKFLKSGIEDLGHECQVLNLGINRKVKSTEYVDVQNGLDYLLKLIWFRLHGWHFHLHTNGQSEKGPILTLAACLVSLLTLERPALTFHGGIQQLYFPKQNGRHMYPVLWLNFILAGLIICNNEAIKREILRYGPWIGAKKIHPIQAFSIQYLKYTKSRLPESIEKFIAAKDHVILCYLVLRNGFFIETAIDFFHTLGPETGVILSGIRKVEDPEIAPFYDKLLKLEQNGIVLLIPDLDHDQFMTLLEKTDIYLRTPVSDGIASSVLEALYQGVPVVASENGRRPASVVTYVATDPKDLNVKVTEVLTHMDRYRQQLIPPEIRDTLSVEIHQLFQQFG